ncbi:MAG TPA: hypothetical protein VK448_08445 [Dissulfurispiraceae bacterium]|nr:hypothetical protein [Dissulfurispiraceae bacterium]
MAVSSVAVFGQQPAELPDPNADFRDQQREINAKLLDYTDRQMKLLNSMKDYLGREQYDSALEYAPDFPPLQPQIRRFRGDDEFNYSRAGLDTLKLRIMEAESRKKTLRDRVIGYNSQLPAWWNSEEEDFLEKRRRAFLSGLKR